MSAKQTPLVDLLRLHAEDLHSEHGHNKSARLLSQAADEIDHLRAELADATHVHTCGPYCEKTEGCRERTYLRTEIDRMTIEWRQAAALVYSLQGELAELRKPDCRTCRHYYEMEEDCFWHRRSTPIVCINGDAYVTHGEPLRLYEKEGKV